MQAVVVIPGWRPRLSDDETLSLRRCLSVLGTHSIALIAPEGLPVDGLPPLAASVAIERFAPRFFEGIGGYNRLMLSADFYRRFEAYDYMLLHQLHAFGFEDPLVSWWWR